MMYFPGYTDSLSQGDSTVSMNQIAGNFHNPLFIVEFVLTILTILAITGFVSYKLRNKFVWTFFSIFDTIFILGFIFDMGYLILVTALILTCGMIIFLFVNAGLVRKYVAIPLKTKNLSEKGNGSKKADVHEKMIKDICTAVEWLSRNRVGGLITFERDTPLDEWIHNGTIINCPVTPEIIETIFYEGTRLHDGAIIIRNDTIVAAACMFPPSTKAMVGKVGARHRAAMGISEVTDAVTIVVSEETGRIGISHAGIMDNVKTSEFEQVFRNSISD